MAAWRTRTPEMGKIFYLSWGVPPDIGGSAIIALNLAKQFRRDEMIVVGEKPCGKPPVAWSDQWPELAYIRSVWPFTGRGIRWWRRLQLPYMLLRCLQLVRSRQRRSNRRGLPGRSLSPRRLSDLASNGNPPVRLLPQHVLGRKARRPGKAIRRLAARPRICKSQARFRHQ